MNLIVVLWFFVQRRVYFENENKIPAPLTSHMSLETFEKARLYGIDKNNFTIVSEFYGMVVLTVSATTSISL